MTKITKFGVLSVAKLQGIVMAIMGLIVGLIIVSINATSFGVLRSLFFAIIVFPIFYGILGFVLGALGAFLYNLVAKRIGGIEIELEK